MMNNSLKVRCYGLPVRWVAKRAVLVTISLLGAVNSVAGNYDHGINRASNLIDEAKLSRSKNLVLVLEFSSNNCNYCRLLENEFLKPMLINRNYSA
jgi:thioredoxin-related protein